MNSNRIISSLKKQSFQPNVLSLFINPFFFIRRGLFRHIKSKATFLSGNMLDFGCGRKPYKSLINVECYVGVDIEVSGHVHENSEIDVFYDGKTIPFPDEYFDSFLCSEVFEHLFNLDDILAELHRVLKCEGHGLITIPFAWPEHEQPYDFGRYTSFAMQHILEKKGFKIVSMEKSGHFIECLFQSTALYIYLLFSTRNRALNTICTFLFITPVNLVGLVISRILPKKNELYHNLVIVVKRVK